MTPKKHRRVLGREAVHRISDQRERLHLLEQERRESKPPALPELVLPEGDQVDGASHG